MDGLRVAVSRGFIAARAALAGETGALAGGRVGWSRRCRSLRGMVFWLLFLGFVGLVVLAAVSGFCSERHCRDGLGTGATLPHGANGTDDAAADAALGCFSRRAPSTQSTTAPSGV